MVKGGGEAETSHCCRSAWRADVFAQMCGISASVGRANPQGSGSLALDILFALRSQN